MLTRLSNTSAGFSTPLSRILRSVPSLWRLPFGGVGASGIGQYHGRWGFEALSHRRAVLAKSAKPDLKLTYPPYTDGAIKIMRKLF